MYDTCATLGADEVSRIHLERCVGVYFEVVEQSLVVRAYQVAALKRFRNTVFKVAHD